MKQTDKFLIGIVAGVVLLVVVAFAVALLRPEPQYQPEDTPEGVAFNYLLALKQGDYERAYGYLSPTLPGYPSSSGEFARDVRAESRSWTFRRLSELETAITIESVYDVSEDEAEVLVRETYFHEGGIFSSKETYDFSMDLQRENGAWRVVDSEEYWLRCWGRAGGCRY